MNLSTRQSLLLLAVIPAGFATGYFARPDQPGPAQVADSLSENPARSRTAVLPAASVSDPKSQPIPQDLRSADFIDDLLAVPADELYERLALWLVDAESSQIHELFTHLSKRPDLHIRHSGLLFTRWAISDPLAAIAAAKATSYARLPWLGWAKKQPLAAFRHAMEHDRSMLEYVLMSIGESDPELARSLLANHPDIPQDLASSGLIRGLAHDDPEAALDLALQTGRHDFGPHEAWLRKDPHAAFQWFLKNREFYATHDSQTDAVIQSIVRENPEVLEELAASTPPGALRRKMEAALFDRLAAENPEKALAEARANPSPLIARERLAKIGALQSEQDPQAARAILEEILKLPPVPNILIYQPGQMDASSAYDPRVMELAHHPRHGRSPRRSHHRPQRRTLPRPIRPRRRHPMGRTGSGRVRDLGLPPAGSGAPAGIRQNPHQKLQRGQRFPPSPHLSPAGSGKRPPNFCGPHRHPMARPRPQSRPHLGRERRHDGIPGTHLRKSMKLLATAAFCFLLATAAGWHFRGNGADAPSEHQKTRLSPRHTRDRQAPRTTAIPADVAARLAPIHNAKNSADRLRATIHLASTLPVSELARWFDNNWFNPLKDADAEVFAEIARTRWLAEDPEGLLDHARLRNWNDLHALAERWARQDPDAALAYLEAAATSDQNTRLKMAMLGGLATSRPDLVLAEAAAFTGPLHAHLWTDILKKLARSNPTALENADLPDGLALLAERALLSAALEQDLEACLTKYISDPEGVTFINSSIANDPSLAGEISSRLLANIDNLTLGILSSIAGSSSFLTKSNPRAWLAVDLSAHGLRQVDIGNFQSNALGALIRIDPEDVLRLLQEIDLDPEIAAGRTTQALTRLAQVDPAKAADWRSKLFPTATDEFALATFFAQQEGSFIPNSHAPRDIVSAINAATASYQNSTIGNFIRSIPPAVRSDLVTHLESLPSEEVADIARKIGTSSFPPALQSTLLTAAIRHPDPTDSNNPPEAAAAALASSWVQDDPTAATRWAATLPAGPARRFVLQNLAAHWAPFDTPAANAWIASLPAADQADVRMFLKTGPPK